DDELHDIGQSLIGVSSVVTDASYAQSGQLPQTLVIHLSYGDLKSVL
ncbi:unnamed protein product, partial [marine sediment metagenome]